MSDCYILDDNKVPVGVNFETWFSWSMEHNPIRVAHDNIEGITISTVFIGCTEMLLFETMVFGRMFNCEQHRYRSWQDAVAGHARVKAKVCVAMFSPS